MPPLKKKQTENKLRPFGKEDGLDVAQLERGRDDVNTVGTGQTDAVSFFSYLIRKSSGRAPCAFEWLFILLVVY